MILMDQCIIDFIGGNGLRGRVGGGGPGLSWALKWHERLADQIDQGLAPGKKILQKF